jgi:hypothetical protein
MHGDVPQIEREPEARRGRYRRSAPTVSPSAPPAKERQAERELARVAPRRCGWVGWSFGGTGDSGTCAGNGLSGTGRPRKGIARSAARYATPERPHAGDPRPRVGQRGNEGLNAPKKMASGTEIRCHQAVCRTASRRPGTDPDVGGSAPAEAPEYQEKHGKSPSAVRSHTASGLP